MADEPWPLLPCGGRARERGGGTRERRIDMGAPLRGHGRAIGRLGAPTALPKGTTMRFTSEQRLADDVLERDFLLGEIPGILWTSGSASTPTPLILLGHPGGLHKMYPRLVARARHGVAEGFAAATIELPGSGDRPRSASAEQARADLHRALRAGEPVTDEIVDRLILPLVEKAVPEWRAAMDALLSLP